MSTTIRSDELPPALRTRLGAAPGTRVRVTVETIQESDADRIDALRADLQAGRDALRAGQGKPFDARTLLRDLHREHEG